MDRPKVIDLSWLSGVDSGQGWCQRVRLPPWMSASPSLLIWIWQSSTAPTHSSVCWCFLTPEICTSFTCFLGCNQGGAFKRWRSMLPLRSQEKTICKPPQNTNDNVQTMNNSQTDVFESQTDTWMLKWCRSTPEQIWQAYLFTVCVLCKDKNCFMCKHLPEGSQSQNLHKFTSCHCCKNTCTGCTFSYVRLTNM